MIFRDAKIEDIPALSELRLSVKENALSDPSRITFEMYQSYLTDFGKGWLGEVNGAVIGFSIASAKDDSIWALFVRREYEGKGVGTKLLSLATQWLFETGASKITLSTATGTRADNFYARAGWLRGEVGSNGEIVYTLDRPEP